MKDEITAKQGRKADAKPENVREAKKAGPLEDNEVEGQSGWILMSCPWCGGMNRCWDTPEMDVWSCGWCGNLFY